MACLANVPSIYSAYVWYRTEVRRAKVHIGISERYAGSVADKTKEANKMSIGMILLVILALALLGVIPTWPHSRTWGYGPSGGIGLILVIVLIVILLGGI